MEKATFAAGCFWGVEETFRKVRGVTSAAVGYMGGTAANPTYQQVCTGKTGHAEVVQLDYDPAIVKYDELLGVFWTASYRSASDRSGPPEQRGKRAGKACAMPLTPTSARASSST